MPLICRSIQGRLVRVCQRRGLLAHVATADQSGASTLELTRIDRPEISCRVDLGTFSDPELRIEASDSGDVAYFTVAIARQDRTHVFID